MTITPFFASASPSNAGDAPLPLVYPPGYAQTSTGLFSDADCAAVHTFRYRQSSLPDAPPAPPFGAPPFAAPPRAPPLPPPPCTHSEPNLSAVSTPSQRVTGCGGFH